MNKTVLIILIVIIVIGGGALYVQSQQKTSSPAVTETPQSTGSDNTMQDDTSSGDASMEDQTTTDADGTVKEFSITGQNFSFTPNKMTVKEGDTVKITFTSQGGMHDFVLNEFNAATSQLQSGESETVEFVADKAGTYEFYCSVGNHRAMGMVGTLTVQ